MADSDVDLLACNNTLGLAYVKFNVSIVRESHLNTVTYERAYHRTDHESGCNHVVKIVSFGGCSLGKLEPLR